MADIVSSDGNCTVRLHTAYASVLVWTPLTGTITVRRNGVAYATLSSAQTTFYDHYPPLGTPTAYSVTNGTTTSTDATITVAAATGMTWVKSGDPSLSAQARVVTFGDVSYDQEQGVFSVVGSGTPFVIFGAPAKRKRNLEFLALTAAVRDTLVAAFQSGPVFVHHQPSADEPAMWAAASKPSVSRTGTVSPGVRWKVAAELTEVTAPATALAGRIIPGWSCDTVRTTYSTVSAMVAANSTCAVLLRAGVS